ncbi:MAG: chemotaxis protein CheD [Polyangiaceae bacterium]
MGSCLGIAIWDPIAKVGGLLHAMLPESATAPEKAAANPSMFVDTGVPALFQEAYSLGAEKARLSVRVAGGATLQVAGESHFQVGQRNITMLRKLFWKNGVLIHDQDLGGGLARTLTLDVESGEAWLKTENGTRALAGRR